MRFLFLGDVVGILIFMAVVPIVLAIGFTLWAVSRPGTEELGAEEK